MKTIFIKLGLALLSLVVLTSCAKETEAPKSATTTPQKQLIIRIKQVENDSTVIYSQRIRVQLRSVN